MMKNLQQTHGFLGSLPESETLATLEKGMDLERRGIKVAMMSVGEPDFDTPEPIKQACMHALKAGYTKYTIPAGIYELRAAIVDKFSENGIKTTPEQVIVSPGGKFANAAAVTALCGPGDEVVLPVPYWVSHLHMINASGATPVLVHTYPGNNYEVTAEALEAAITEKTRLLILCSPSNPTGTVYRKEALEEIAHFAVKHNFMVLSDEVYEKLTFIPELPHISIASLSPEIAERTITINSFSKSYAMTGWRVGYLTAPTWLAAKIGALQTHFVANATTFAQYGALTALQDCESECERMRKIFSARRDLICELLSTIPNIRFVNPSGAFYVFVDISAFGLSSMAFCCRMMEDVHVVVAPGISFGVEGFIRISYACSEDTIRDAMAAFARFCLSLKNS
ncbi:MAG: pyridoxal phosphate-dependent aminotransferase [Verrucomicrobiae bacterium]|nr:pyridoxal phosphate-dependent aminotransferase [Verrucomicrobiae bacterium]